MSFWVLENDMHNYVKIHRGDCYHCNNGTGPRNDRTGLWRGGFHSYQEAQNWARNSGRPIEHPCKHCHPERN